MLSIVEFATYYLLLSLEFVTKKSAVLVEIYITVLVVLKYVKETKYNKRVTLLITKEQRIKWRTNDRSYKLRIYNANYWVFS